MARKYRGLRAHGMDVFTAAVLALLSKALGQPAGLVSVMHFDFEV